MDFLNVISRHSTDRSLTRLFLVGFIALILLGSGRLNGLAQETISREYQVKAACLYNFTQFVEWSPEAFADKQTPLVIGILGNDPYGGFLDELVRGEELNNHPLVVRRFQRIEDIQTCHILFISRSESGKLEQILPGLKGRNILTVGETAGFAQHGGMIRFVTETGKTRFRVNVDAAREAGLTISSRLLRLAEIVPSKKN